MSRLVTRAELADTKGVSRAAVTKACRPGGALHLACQGDRVDLDHAHAVAYMSGQVIDGSGKVARPKAKASKAKPPAPPSRPKRTKAVEIPHDLEDYADLTLREILQIHGTETALKDFLAAAKTLEEIREKKLKNAEREGSLISRDLVEKSIFGTIDATFVRLLADTPKTLASKLFSAARTGLPEADGEKIAKVEIERQIKVIKTAAKRALSP